MALFVAMLLIGGCAQSVTELLPHGPATGAKVVYPTLDDEPEFECSRPPDDALLYSAFSSESTVQYFSSDSSLFMVAYLDFTSWLLPAEADYLSDGQSSGEITEEVAFDVTIYGVPRFHPTWYQGEETTTQDARYGLNPSFSILIYSYTDGDYRSESSTGESLGDVQDLGHLCLSHIRDDRIAGMAGLLPRSNPGLEDFPQDVYVVFSNASVPLSYPDYAELEHSYTTDRYPRLLAWNFDQYYEISPPNVWSLPSPDDSDDTGADG